MASSSSPQSLNATEATLYQMFGKTPNIVLTTLVNKEFHSKTFENSEIYFNSEGGISADQLDHLGALLLDYSEKGFKNPLAAKLIYLLATQLRDPADPTTLIFKDTNFSNQQNFSQKSWGFAGKDELTLTAQEIEDLKPLPQTEDEWEAYAMASFKSPETAGLSATEADKKITDAKISHISGVKTTQSLAHKAAMKKKKKADSVLSSGTGKTGATPSYWPFAAAYLMKSLIKVPENVMLGEEHMRNRYIGFYPEGTPAELKLTIDGLHNLQLRLKADPMILRSWIAITAEYESTKESTLNTAGIVRYLANLQFSYNGMHAYGLFREVLLATKWTPGEAIMKMWMAPTADALKTIHRIITEYESTVSDDGKVTKKSTYFKYARVIDPQHFLALQPSQCLSLLYLCCKILNHYTTKTELADPMKMIALQKMGPERKEYLDFMAEEIITRASEDVSEKTSIEIAASAKYKQKKEKPAAEVKAGLLSLSAITEKLRKRKEQAAREEEE